MISIKLCSEQTIRTIEQFLIVNNQRDKVLVLYEPAYDAWACVIPFNVEVILTFKSASNLALITINGDILHLDTDEVKVVIE